MTAAIGFRAHTAWAACVVLDGPADDPRVVERCRVELVEGDLPRQVYHAAGSLPPAQAEELVERAMESARDVAVREIRRLCTSGHDVAVAGVVLGSGRASTDVAKATASHAGKHAAEGEMARQVLIDACGTIGLDVTGVRERDLSDRGASVLGLSQDDPYARVKLLGRAVGAPWAKDQRDAALVAWIALATRR
jgi:hypothetical protein